MVRALLALPLSGKGSVERLVVGGNTLQGESGTAIEIVRMETAHAWAGDSQVTISRIEALTLYRGSRGYERGAVCRSRRRLRN